MGNPQKAPAVAARGAGPPPGVNRRKRERVQLALPAHVRPFNPQYGRLEEVRETRNFTRDGLYFTTALDHYYVGMRVLLVFPWEVGPVRRQYLGEVVRVELFPRGRRGIAIRFLF